MAHLLKSVQQCLPKYIQIRRLTAQKEIGRFVAPRRKDFKDSYLPPNWKRLIEKYPDFLPDPMNNSPPIVNRMIDDMLARRKVIEIPEFYVGSILAVTVSDQYSSNKRTKFVGICIERKGQLHFANFTLRNVIDGLGCEVRYDLYNPLLLSIEVLKLEKRLDDSLIYLRDALPEYSTVPEDMQPVVNPNRDEVPINRLQVKMKPHPWSRRWERRLAKGIECLPDIPKLFADSVKKVEDSCVYNYDLMLEYRQHCTEEMVYHICRKLAAHEKEVVEPREEAKSKKFLKVTKTT